MEPKLRVSVHLDIESQQVRVTVRGRVTCRNSPALYVVARRAAAAVPGASVLVDLSRAAVSAEALAGLWSSSATGSFVLATGTPLPGGSLAPGQMSLLPAMS